jgi:Tol biopolymer transport system component
MQLGAFSFGVVAACATACVAATDGPPPAGGLAALPEPVTVALTDRPSRFDRAGQIAFNSDRFGRNGLVLLSLMDWTLVHLTSGREDNAQNPSWSPDCTQLAYDTTTFDRGNLEIAVLTLGAGLRRITSTLHAESRPTWSHDGRSLIFETQDPRSRSLVRVWLDRGVTEPLATGPRAAAPALSPTDDTLAYVKGDATGLRLTLRRPGISTEQSVSPPGLDTADPAWSRDGRRLAYVVLNADQPTLVISEADAVASTLLVAPDVVSIRDPSWAPDGSALAVALRPSAGSRWALAIVEPASARAFLVTDGTANDAAPAWRPCD